MKNKFIKHIDSYSETGFTIIEMLVAMTIAAIFFASFTAVIVATMQTMRTGDQRTVAQQNSRIAINFMADEIKQASELEPPSFAEYRDPRTKGIPTNGEVVDGNGNEVYPIIRRSTDGSTRGFIDLNNLAASGGTDEYEMFREGLTGTSDGQPYDVRPLFPNKISFLMNQSSYFPNTRYSSYDPNLVGGLIDIDGPSIDTNNNSDNFQSVPIRISYEHQKQPPRTGMLADEGTIKDLYLTVLGPSGGGVNLLDKPFVLLRDFEVDNVTGGSINDSGRNESFRFFTLYDALGNDLGVNLPVPSPSLRQIVADHVLDIRFRYFHIRGGAWIEIKYDPYTEHMGQGAVQLPDNVNDGYYRYFNQWGEEIFVWATYNGGSPQKIDIPTSNVVQEYKDNYSDLTFMPANEFERGMLLFEGWKFVNAIMITVKGSNQELLDTYLRTQAAEINNPGSGNYDTTNPDFGLGFIDFQKGGGYLSDVSGENAANPLWHAVDSYREGIDLPPGNNTVDPLDARQPFDIADPNTNPSFDPGRFVTLQTIVIPPIFTTTAEQAAQNLTYGLSFV